MGIRLTAEILKIRGLGILKEKGRLPQKKAVLEKSEAPFKLVLKSMTNCPTDRHP